MLPSRGGLLILNWLLLQNQISLNSTLFTVFLQHSLKFVVFLVSNVDLKTGAHVFNGKSVETSKGQMFCFVLFFFTFVPILQIFLSGRTPTFQRSPHTIASL